MTASSILRRRLKRAREDDRGIVVSQGDVRELLELRVAVARLQQTIGKLLARGRKVKADGQVDQ